MQATSSLYYERVALKFDEFKEFKTKITKSTDGQKTTLEKNICIYLLHTIYAKLWLKLTYGKFPLTL